MLAICDMADASGCSIHHLVSQLSSQELMLRVTNRLMARGWTFDREKIKAMHEEKERLEYEAFMQRARKHWEGN